MDYIVVKESIQAAVTEACRRDVRTVVIPEGKWHLTEPVCLPDGITVILENAEIFSGGCVFCNGKENLPYALATEQRDIHIIGFGNSALHSQGDTVICFCNVQSFSVTGISAFGGVLLRHARKGRVGQLKFTDSRFGIRMEEGCRELIIEDICGNTKEETVAWIGGDTTLWGRSNEMCQSMAKRIHGKTDGAPVVSIRQGRVEAELLTLWDITDDTCGAGCSVLLGQGEAAVRDITVRNISTHRTPLKIGDTCDGIYVTGEGEISEKATRVLTAEGKRAALPQYSRYTGKKWLSANDPRFRDTTDAATLQNAIAAAAEENAVLLIPRHNERTGRMLWEMENTLSLPSGITLVLLDAHLRMADFTYCNMLAAENRENICVLGIGSATVDSGIPNGLKRKTAGKHGFGAITDNALLRFVNCKNLLLKGIRICQSRWYGVYCADCCNVTLADMCYYAPGIFPDLGGVYIAGGCKAVSAENIMGILGDDAVHVEAAGNAMIQNISVGSVVANVCRWCAVRLVSRDGSCIQNVSVEGIVDSSVPEQKMMPRAMVCIGDPTASGELSGVLVRDVCGRGSTTVELGGKSRDVQLQNIHSFGTAGSSVRCSPVPEVREFILMDVQEKLCACQRKDMTVLKNCSVDGVFFRCIQGSAYMRGTATSMISDKKKFVGKIMDLTGLETEAMHIKNVFAQPVGEGILVSGKAKVNVENLQVLLCGREEAVCGSGCELVINGKKMEIINAVKL